MTKNEFEGIVKETMSLCLKEICQSTDEWEGEDKLRYFKQAAELQGITPIKALAGMMAKEIVHIYEMCKAPDEYSPEVWDERTFDCINYLLYLQALLIE